MSTKIEVGRYVATREPDPRRGWWIGKVSKDCGMGLYKAQIVWAENLSGAKEITVFNGKTPERHNFVSFYSFKEAYRFMRRRKRAFDYNCSIRPSTP